MIKYHKINGLYKRDERGQFTGEFAQPEFEYLYDKEWVGTEKIDGTNIRIHYSRSKWDGPGNAIEKKVRFGGRTDNAQIPTFLLEKLEDLDFLKRFELAFPGDEELEVTLYGEGYGRKIQKGGGNYIPDGVDFILFDVKIGNWWMKREDVDGIAKKMGIDSVPVIFRGNLAEAILKVKGGFKSTIGTADAEGLVLVPSVDLFTRGGERIITKLKTKDFR